MKKYELKDRFPGQSQFSGWLSSIFKDKMAVATHGEKL